MNMTLEQLKEALKQTEAEPVVQNGSSNEERESYERQRQHLPLRYRKHVTEFQ